MGGRGASFNSNQSLKDYIRTTDRYSDNMVGLDYSGNWRDAIFSSPGALLRTVNRGDDRRYDILDNNRWGDGDGGSIAFIDKYGSDGIVYEVRWQKSYANKKNPGEIRVISFKEYEEDEY